MAKHGPKKGSHYKPRHDSGPDEDALFYACFECPYRDCRHHVSIGKECPFRIEWGKEHGVDPGYLAQFTGK